MDNITPQMIYDAYGIRALRQGKLVFLNVDTWTTSEYFNIPLDARPYINVFIVAYGLDKLSHLCKLTMDGGLIVYDEYPNTSNISVIFSSVYWAST